GVVSGRPARYRWSVVLALVWTGVVGPAGWASAGARGLPGRAVTGYTRSVCLSPVAPARSPRSADEAGHRGQCIRSAGDVAPGEARPGRTPEDDHIRRGREQPGAQVGEVDRRA